MRKIKLFLISVAAAVPWHILYEHRQSKRKRKISMIIYAIAIRTIDFFFLTIHPFMPVLSPPFASPFRNISLMHV